MHFLSKSKKGKEKLRLMEVGLLSYKFGEDFGGYDIVLKDYYYCLNNKYQYSLHMKKIDELKLNIYNSFDKYKINEGIFSECTVNIDNNKKDEVDSFFDYDQALS